MKKEDLFCTQAQATRLKSLGVAQQSAYPSKDGMLAAFSAPELGAMLPTSLSGGKYELKQWRYDKDGKEHYGIAYKYWENKKHLPLQGKVSFGKTEAEARASYLIWLLENKVIGVDEINLRLLAA